MAKMQRRYLLGLYGIAVLVFNNSFAAELKKVWDTQPHVLTKFSVINSGKFAGVASANLYTNNTSNGAEQLKLAQALVDKQGISHVRYNQYFQGIPVFGMQVIYHTGKTNTGPVVTGNLLDKISEDIKSVTPKYNAEAIIHHAQDVFQASNNTAGRCSKAQAELVIYPVNKANKTTAKLAYTVSFFTKIKGMLMQPFYIIDANTKEVLAYWDNLERGDVAPIGQGQGGNEKPFPAVYKLRPNHFQYGQHYPELPSLGKLTVTVKGEKCYAENKAIKVISFNNEPVADIFDFFPVLAKDDSKYPVFEYECSPDNGYVNEDDGGAAPINGGFSPINDALYFATVTYDMLTQKFGIAKPFGDDLPVRVYTHIAQTKEGEPESMNNAFAMPAEYDSHGALLSHQQIGLGNGSLESGKYHFYPMTQGTVPHELGHLFVGSYSKLIYKDQSGGINESVADTCDVVTRAHIHSQYPWYTYDWQIGAEETKAAEPIRYMDTPTADGKSIDNAADFYPGMRVHYSSGVFNKAFYLLSHRPGWSIDKAFSVIADANMNYWTPSTDFNEACLALAQVASNHGYNPDDIIKTYRSVGVDCKF